MHLVSTMLALLSYRCLNLELRYIDHARTTELQVLADSFGSQLAAADQTCMLLRVQSMLQVPVNVSEWHRWPLHWKL